MNNVDFSTGSHKQPQRHLSTTEARVWDFTSRSEKPLLNDLVIIHTHFLHRSIIELCSGNIGVASTPEVGSTFAFFIGTRVATLPSPEQEVESVKSVPVRPTSADGTLVTGNVLLVEDNLVNV